MTYAETEKAPYPDKLNEYRSRWAAAAIEEFVDTTDICDDADVLSDLLCDIAHFCDRNRKTFGDFTKALKDAIALYAEETDGTGKQFNGISINEADTL